MNRRTISVRLTEEEHEWLRRYSHWKDTSMSQVLRSQVHGLAADSGYLRPPDDEPQDFGDEKQLMQWIESVTTKR